MENKTTNLRPFKLKEALAGKPLIVENSDKERLPVTNVHKVGDWLCLTAGGDHNLLIFDLRRKEPIPVFMAPTKRTVWVNLYYANFQNAYFYQTEELANANIKLNGLTNRIGNKAYPIEIEE